MSVTLLQVGELSFAITRSARRRTMQITVDRDGELKLAAPPEVEESRLRQFVEEKRFWIYSRLAEKERLLRIIPRKQFVDGEGFLYLGRSLRLRLVEVQLAPLRLLNGRFCLARSEVNRARDHFIRWYSAYAQKWLAAKVAEYQVRMEVSPAGVKVQDLGYRWGSCGKGGWLYFHWKTILLPAWVAEYVVVHEIAHLYESHHTPEFWLRVERALPDFERRKVWLAEHGMGVEGL